MRKFSALTAFLMAALMLSGCAPAQAQTILKVAAPSQDDVWTQVAQAFNAYYPDVKVTLTDMSDSPDVVLLLPGDEATGQALEPVAQVLNQIVPGEDITVAEKLPQGLAQGYQEGRTQVLPMFATPYGLRYNSARLTQHGWALPATFTDWLALGEKAQAEGLTLFAYDSPEALTAFMYALMGSVGGGEFFNRVISYEESVWEGLEGNEYFQAMEALLSYTGSDPEKALFMPGGAQDITGDWQLAALPKWGEHASAYAYLDAGQCYIPAGALQKETAATFIAFLYSDEAAQLLSSQGLIQPIRGVSRFVQGGTQAAYTLMDQQDIVFLWGGFIPVNSDETMDNALVSAFDQVRGGTITLDNWRAQVMLLNDVLGNRRAW